MSLRSTSLRVLRSTTSPTWRGSPVAARSLQTTSQRRADHSDHSHGSSANDKQYETRETWFAGPPRNFLILSAIAYFAYPYLPERFEGNFSPTTDPERWNQLCNDPSASWVARTLARQFTTKQENDQRAGDDFLEAAYKATSRFILWENKTVPPKTPAE